jgi:hypothetical protein
MLPGKQRTKIQKKPDVKRRLLLNDWLRRSVPRRRRDRTGCLLERLLAWKELLNGEATKIRHYKVTLLL